MPRSFEAPRASTFMSVSHTLTRSGSPIGPLKDAVDMPLGTNPACRLLGDLPKSLTHNRLV